MKPNWHYYEAHIEIAPIDQKNISLLKDDLQDLGFNLVDLVGIEREYNLNLITTFHADNLSDLQDVVYNSVKQLKALGYDVKRYKIESTVIDSKFEDKLELLGRTRDDIVVQHTNSLKTRVGKGYLSNLVANIRNNYHSNPDYSLDSKYTRLLIEAFMTELYGTDKEQSSTEE